MPWGMHTKDTPGKGRILIVDDEESIRKALRLTLTKAGYDIVEAEDGATAIEAMEEWLENVSLRSIAETLWEYREYEFNDLARSMIGRTTLALQFKAAAEQYAMDNAEMVRAQTLLDAEQDSAADAAIDDAQQGGEA